MGHTMAEPPEQEERRCATIREMVSLKDVAGLHSFEVESVGMFRRPTRERRVVNIGSRL